MVSADSSKIGRHAFTTVLFSSFGIVTSVLLDAIIMGLYGMGWQTDAYFIAITIPMVAITVIALQATRVVQPIFISKRQSEGENEAWGFVSLILTNGTTFFASFALLGALVSPIIIGIQAIGSGAASLTLSTKLSVMFFLILPLYIPIAIMRVVLNSLGSFGLPASMKFIETAFKILFVLLLGRQIGVMALPLGMFCGALCQISMYYIALRNKGYRFRPVFRFFDPDLVNTYRLMVFPLVGQLCQVVVELVNNAFASMLGSGNVSALRLATRIIESFGGLLAGSIVLAVMPAIASSVAKGDFDGAKRDVRQGLYLLLLVTAPLSIWLALTNRPFIALIYERMRFSAADTALVANVLLTMIPYIFLGRLMGLFELPFFARHDTKTPLLGSTTQAALYVVISVLCIRTLGIYALTLSRSLSFLAASLLLLHLLRRRIGNLGFGCLRTSLAKVAWASLVMAFFILIGARLSALMPAGGFVSQAIALGVPTLTGGIGLLATLMLVRVLQPSMVKRALFR